MLQRHEDLGLSFWALQMMPLTSVTPELPRGEETGPPRGSQISQPGLCSGSVTKNCVR